VLFHVLQRFALTEVAYFFDCTVSGPYTIVVVLVSFRSHNFALNYGCGGPPVLCCGHIHFHPQRRHGDLINLIFASRKENGIKMDFKQLGLHVHTGLLWLRIGSGMGCCEHCNGPSGTRKEQEFIDHLNECQVLKKNSASRS
jgi:hypothetical protein